MTSTCGGIRWGRAEGQYLFKLITSGCKACVYVHTYLCLVFIVHTCGKEDMWGSVIVYASLHMSVHRHGFYWYKHTRLWCDSAWASVWPPRVHPWPAALLMACSSRSASLTFQLWRFWHASGSMTRQLHISLLPAQPVICQRLTTKPQLASDHFWQIIYLLVCLPVTHTHSHRDLFSVFLRETVPLPPLPPLLLLTHPSSYR